MPYLHASLAQKGTRNVVIRVAYLIVLGLILVACGASTEQLKATSIVARAQTQTVEPKKTSTPTFTPTSSPTPTRTSTPTITTTPTPNVEVFGPMDMDSTWELIVQNYRKVEWLGSWGTDDVDAYCEELIDRASYSEFDYGACEFAGVSMGFEGYEIDGLVFVIPRDYKDLIWVAPNVMQHKDGPELLVCGENSFQEEVYIYETESGGMRLIFTGWDLCTEP